MREVHVRSRHFNGGQLSGIGKYTQYFDYGWVFFGGGGAYARDKNTSVRVCAKNAGGAYAWGGAYLRDTTVFPWFWLTAEFSAYLPLFVLETYSTNAVTSCSTKQNVHCECVTMFEVLWHRTSVKGEAHMHWVDMSGICATTQHIWSRL